MALQAVYAATRAAARSSAPSALQAVVDAVSSLPVADVLPDHAVLSTLHPGRVYFRPIIADRHCDLALWLLGPGGVMPLHDHPGGMHVVTRVLAGAMDVQCMDIEPSQTGTERSSSSSSSSSVLRVSRLQTVTLSATATASATASNSNSSSSSSSLHVTAPGRGELHSMRGSDGSGGGSGGAVFLDVVWPPYSPARECRYYTLLHATTNSSSASSSSAAYYVRRLAWDPPDWHPQRQAYTGVQLQ